LYYENGFGAEKNWNGAPRYKRGLDALVAQAYYGDCLIRGRGVKKNVARGSGSSDEHASRNGLKDGYLGITITTDME